MKINHYLFILLIIGLSNCQNKKQSIKEDTPKTINDFPKVNQNQAYVGSYLGVLPCGDCEGMETKIILNENYTYTKSVRYLGKGIKIFEQKGSFKWNDLGNVVLLDDIKNAPNQYLVVKDKLIQLDLEGTIIQGNLSKDYELSKQLLVTSDMQNNQPETDKVNLNNKLESSASIQKVNPAEGKYTLAKTKWKLLKLNGKTVKQSVSKVNFIKMNSSDGKFTAFAGCNQIFGSYAMPSVNTISFSDIGSTRMFCPDNSIENDYLHMLEETTNYKLDNETLAFYGSTKTPIAIFVAVK